MPVSLLLIQNESQRKYSNRVRVCLISTETESISVCINAITGSDEPSTRYVYTDKETIGVRVDATAGSSEPEAKQIHTDTEVYGVSVEATVGSGGIVAR